MTELLTTLWGDFAAPGYFLSLNTQAPGANAPLTHWYPMGSQVSGIPIPEGHTDGDVWFGVASRRQITSTGRGGNDDINAVPALWVDFDFVAGEAHASKNLPTMAQATAWIDSLLAPNAVVHTAHGFHCYWVFDEPWTFAPGQYASAQGLLKAFQEKVRQAGNGFHLDDTSHPSQMLRYPGSFNRKPNMPAFPVKLLGTDDNFRPREELADWAGHKITDAVAVAVLENFVHEGDVELIPFDKARVIDALAANTSKQAALAKVIVSGRPLAEAGNRNNTTNAAASLVAFTAHSGLRMAATIDDIFDVLAPAYMAMATAPGAVANPPPSETEVRKQIKKGLAHAHKSLLKKIAEEKAADEAVARMRDGLGKYTEEEVKKYAETAEVSVEDFSKRWIIAHDGRYWTFYNGEYRTTPWPKDDLLTALHQDLGMVPGMIWDRATPNGGSTPKPASLIVQENGTVASNVRMSLIAQKTYYDEKTGTFVLATAPLAPLPAKYNADVDKWLRLLGGDQQELLLDWVASVTDHTTPSSAIYLQGPAGAGKTMLANGLAKLWRSGTFTAFENTLKFNYNITSSPLIFADEHTPRSRENSVTGTLRRYIANSMHHVEQKMIPVRELEGCVRVLLCANNGDLLTDGNESNTREDVEAIAQRIVHIAATDEPGNFLRSLGGRAGTIDWVSGNVIASHAVWLKANRTPKMGSRFLNEGTRTDFHTGMMSQGDGSIVVVEAILRGVVRPTPGIIVGDGYVLVNAQMMLAEWDTLSPSSGSKTPATVDRIGRVLKRYAYGDKSIQLRIGKTRNRYWCLDCSHIIPHGERNGFDMQQFEARLKNPLPAELREELQRNEKLLTRVHSAL